jgi:ribosomal protein S11
MGKEATRVRRRERKNIASGIAHVNSSFNNTTITITDAQGNTIAWKLPVRVRAANRRCARCRRRASPSPRSVT